MSDQEMFDRYAELTRREWANMIQTQIPEHMWGGVLRYLLHGIKPGSFLRALFEDSFSGVYTRADYQNLRALTSYAQMLIEAVPYGCWGSREDVEKWVESGGLEGILNKEEDTE